MLLYKYDKETKEYLGCFNAQLNPVRSKREGREVYAYPPNTTMIAPKERPKDRYVLVFKGDKWIEVEDNRGLTVYNSNGDAIVIEELGSIPDNYSLEKVYKLKEIKEIKSEEIKEAYFRAYNSTVKIGELEVGISDALEIKNSLEAFKEFGSVNIKGELLSTEEAEKIIKLLYIRSMLLSLKRKELMKVVSESKRVEELERLEANFDVNEEKYMDFSIEELQEKLRCESNT